MMAFADRLAATMQSREFGVRELGRRADVDPSTISNLLKGKHEPNQKTVEALAAALNVKMWELVGDERPEWSPEVLTTAAALERLKPSIRKRVLPLVQQIVSTYSDPKTADERVPVGAALG